MQCVSCASPFELVLTPSAGVEGIYSGYECCTRLLRCGRAAQGGPFHKAVFLTEWLRLNVPIIFKFARFVPNRGYYRSQNCTQLSNWNLQPCVLLRSCHSFHIGTRVLVVGMPAQVVSHVFSARS